MKKLLCILFSASLCVGMLCALTIASHAAEEKTIYLAGNGKDSNAGTTPDEPKKTLSAAIQAIGDADGTIVITRTFVIQSGDGMLPKHAGTITITSMDGDTDYNTIMSFKENLFLGGKTVFENLRLQCNESYSIFCGGNDTVFGKNLTVRYTSDASLSIYGGNDTTRSDASLKNIKLSAFTLQIDSGEWNKVYCGNYRSTPQNLSTTLTGDTTLIINGGTFHGGVSATGSEHRNGNVQCIINGGTFLCSVYGIAEPCDAYDGVVRVTGDLHTQIYGGTFTGDITAAAREDETLFTGTYTLDLLGGDFSRVNRVDGVEGTRGYADGKCTSTLNLGKDIDLDAAQSGMIEFQNSIADFADPSILYHDGWYYYVYSHNYKGGAAVWMRRAANFSDISNSIPQLIWSAVDSDVSMRSLWAPQLTYVEGQFYLYATCAYTDSQDGRRPVVWVSNTQDPTDGFTYHGIVDNVDEEVYMYLSPRFIEWGGKRYMICGGFFRRSDREEGVKHYQSLFVTEMASPTAFAGKAVKISEPTESWEISNGGKCKIQEGPYALYAENGTLYVIYSANETATDNYCTGLLRFDGKETDSITDASLWYKYPDPIHQKNPSASIYSPGAAIIIPSPDGKEQWFVYHAKIQGGNYTYDNRILFAQKVTFSESGEPQVNTPQALTTVFSYAKNTMPLRNRFGSFDETVNLPDSTPPVILTQAPETTSTPEATVAPETTEAPTTSNAQISPGYEGGFPVLPIAIGAVLLCGAAAAAVILKKKKNK